MLTYSVHLAEVLGSCLTTSKPPNYLVTLGKPPCFSEYEDWMLSVVFYPSFIKPGTLKIIKISSLNLFFKSQSVHGECSQNSNMLSMFFFERCLTAHC